MRSNRMTKRCRPVFAYLNTWIKPGDAGDDLPLLHRLAIVYLMLPVVVWLVGWFEWWFGIPAVVLLMLAFWQALSGSWRLRLGPATVALLLVALGWVMMTGAGGLLDRNNWDWWDHRTLLLELSHYPWPTYLPDPLVPHLTAQTEPLLRYYLGWYMVPALVALMFGPAALNWAVPLWTWIGVALILLLFTRRHRGWRIFLAAAVVICFSGMDILRVILVEGWTWIDLRDWFGIDERINHIERYYWGLRTLYPSNMTALMWGPHHFISACLYALLLLDLCRQPRFLAVSGILLATALFWSPFVAIGLLPLLAVLFFLNGIQPFLRWQNLILSWLLAGLVVLYLTSGSMNFPHGWSMEGCNWSMILQWTALFYLTECFPIAILISLLRPGLRYEPFFIASVATLLLLPWYRYSEWNNLVMRSSLPSLFLICYWCADVLARQRVDLSRKVSTRHLALVGLAIALCVGSVTAFVEVARATRNDGFLDYAQIEWRRTTMNMPFYVQKENTAWNLPGALRWLLRDSDGTIQTYEKGDLLVGADFDVYRWQNHLIYVKEQCNADDGKSPLYINPIPVNRADLPSPRRVLGFDEITYGFHKIGNACGVAWKLPSYDLAGIRTGQRFRDEGAWEIEMTFDAEGNVHVVNKDFRTDYDAIASNDPIIRADFDVYLHENELIYVKDPCRLTSRKDIFLHLIPEDVNDLIGPTRDKGFDETSFNFVHRAVKFDGKCMATIPLPDYAIAGIRTGQPANDGSIAWEAEFSVSR